MSAPVAMVVGCALALAACVRVDEHRCARDEDCTGGVAGRCEADLHCSFAGVGSCERGYGAGAGSQSDTCIFEDAGFVDTDGDGVRDKLDNCASIANADQHDEDADTIGDVCDNCPARSNDTQVDTDGDELGDLCDPRIGGRPNRIVLFDPLTAASAPAWSTTIGDATFGDDTLSLSGPTTMIDRAYQLDRDDQVELSAAVTIDETTPGQPGAFAVVAPLAGLQFVACGVQDDADGSRPYVLVLDQGSMTTQTRLGIVPGGFGTGTELEVTYAPGVPPQNAVCTVTLGEARVGGAAPVTRGPNGRVGFVVSGLGAQARYLFGYTR